MFDVNAPVFIIGGSRTGSELHKNILSTYTDIDLVPEMWLRCPFWLHTDLEKNLKHEFRDTKNADLDALLDYLYSGKPFGMFWKRIEKDIPRDVLADYIQYYGTDIKGIFAAIMRAHAEGQGKQVPGAKFPVHYSEAAQLLEWFPNCKLVHTMRDPRAVYASQAKKHKDQNASGTRNAWMAFRQFLHINLQFIWAVSVHKKLEDCPNYFLSRYEDIIITPESSLRKLCDFLGVPFDEQMTRPSVWSNSSFRDDSQVPKGLSKDSLLAWKHLLSNRTVRIMNVVNGSRLIKMGYDL